VTAVSRRQFLALAGAASAAAAIEGCAAARWKPGGKSAAFDREVDVVVVGTGAAGSVAALFAASDGAEVLLLEKAPTFGGTTAKSGGVYFIPGNRFEREKGMKESREATIQDMARNSYPLVYREGAARHGLSERDHALLEGLYDNGLHAVDGLEKMGALISMPADVMVGPLPDYVDTTRQDEKVVDRRLWAKKPDGSFGLGDEMVRQLRAAIDGRKIPVLLGHRARRLVTNAKGEAVGLEAETMKRETVRIRARRGVVFASGGFTHNPDLIRHYQPGPVFGGCAVPTNEGDFVAIAQTVGAKLGHMNSAWRAQIVLEQALQFSSTPDDVFMPPGDSMIVVNRLGRRVVNEKTNYNERTRVHFAWDPFRKEWVNALLFMIYDRRTAELFAGRFPLPPAGASAPYVVSADDLPALGVALDKRLERHAARTGGLRLDAGFSPALAESVRRFNRAAETGVDADFHRGEQLYDREWHAKIWSFANQGTKHQLARPNVTMHPLAAKGPYHAIILAPGTLDTNGGPVVDRDGRVLDASDRPIAGLYGAGNCVASPTAGCYYAGGGTLGIALAFAYAAGRSAAAATPTELV
jgi:3-oxosteroid 1-dehydrogenase